MTTAPTLQSLDDIRSLFATLPGPDTEAMTATDAREPQLTKPPGALGRLEKFSRWLAAWQGSHPPTVNQPRVIVFAGNHGVTAQGVSAYPADVTAQMVENFRNGGAAINQISAACGATLEIIDMGVEIPTADFSAAPAMSESECAAAMARGYAAAIAVDSKGYTADVLCLGEMGIGNTTSAAAICHALYGETAEFWTGPGTGVEGDALDHKARVISDAVARHRNVMNDGLDVLRHVGGWELAGIAGAILGARLNRIPVVLDGYVGTAAAAVLEAAQPGALDHCIVGHVSTEPGHQHLLQRINKEPVLDLGMRLGEGTGAGLAISILKSAVACHTGMATFAGAGVSDRDRDDD